MNFVPEKGEKSLEGEWKCIKDEDKTMGNNENINLHNF